MTPQLAEELIGTLKQKPLRLDELYERAFLSGSTWSIDQIALFLLCVDGVKRDDLGLYHASDDSEEDALRAAIIAAVRSFSGKPVTAAQVRSRLPNHFVTTDEIVLAITRQTVGLEIFGPKLIRIAL